MNIGIFFDFCSGIGGGRLGLEQVGLKCVGYSDTSRLAVVLLHINYYIIYLKKLILVT